MYQTDEVSTQLTPHYGCGVGPWEVINARAATPSRRPGFLTRKDGEAKVWESTDKLYLNANSLGRGKVIETKRHRKGWYLVGDRNDKEW